MWGRPTPRWGGGRNPRAEEREQMRRLRFKPEQGLNLSDLPHQAAAGAQTASLGSQGQERLSLEEQLQERCWEQGARAGSTS